MVVASNCSFCDIVRSVGEMCHRPNSTDDASAAPRSLDSVRPQASSTPRKMNSSGMTVNKSIGIAISNNSRGPDTSARESSKKSVVAGTSRTTSRTVVVIKKATTP